MEITLEQIELVKDRTGVSYKEAKEALEFAGGNVVDAIIYIEENIDNEYASKDNPKVASIVEALKETVRKGNVSKIKVTKDDEVVLNLPVNVGLVGTVLFPWGAVASVLAAGLSKCRIELVRNDGSVVDVSKKAGDAFETVKTQGSVVVDEVVEKSQSVYEYAKDKGQIAYEFAKDKGAVAYEFAKDKAGDIAELIKKSKANAAEEAPAEEPAEEAPCCCKEEAPAETEEPCCCKEEPAAEENKVEEE